jgi:hypothetical protein
LISYGSLYLERANWVRVGERSGGTYLHGGIRV